MEGKLQYFMKHEEVLKRTTTLGRKYKLTKNGNYKEIQQSRFVLSSIHLDWICFIFLTKLIICTFPQGCFNVLLLYTWDGMGELLLHKPHNHVHSEPEPASACTVKSVDNLRRVSPLRSHLQKIIHSGHRGICQLQILHIPVAQWEIFP